MTTKLQKEKIIISCRRAWEQTGKGKMLLGVSGGADSTALLLAFSKAGIPFEAAHCNFNLRASESLRDRDFVKMLCKNYGIKLQIAEFNVPKEALKGESVEITCRRLRYDFFHNLKDKGEFDRIVIGHNADDNVETFFLHALRGSGSRGLKAMDEDNGTILRPLLKYRRKELVEFLNEHEQSYVTDSSNLHSEDYRRNFLRNEIFPLLESKWEGFTRAVTSTIELQKRDNRIVEYFTARALKGITDFLPWHIVYNFPDSATIIFRFINPFGGTPVIAREMAASAERLMPGKKWKLSDTDVAVFTRKGIMIRHLSDEDNEGENAMYQWERIEKDQIDPAVIKSAPLNVIYLPGDESDYRWENANIKMMFKPLGLDGSQPVWKILKDYGLTTDERKSFKVLINKKSEEPVWLPGIKRSRFDLITPDTEVIFKVSGIS